MSNEATNPASCQTAVMLSLRVFSTKLQSKQGFLFFFVGGRKNISLFSCVYHVHGVSLCKNLKQTI